MRARTSICRQPQCSIMMLQAGVQSDVDGGGRRPLTSLYEMIRCVRFMYVCDLARVQRPHTSFLGLHSWLRIAIRTAGTVWNCYVKCKWLDYNYKMDFRIDERIKYRLFILVHKTLNIRPTARCTIQQTVPFLHYRTIPLTYRRCFRASE